MVIVGHKVIGIDCGTAIVGWAVMMKKNNKLEQEDSGNIITPKNLDMFLRLKIIYEKLLEIIEKFSPTEMAIEDIFYFKNNKTVISVSQARGVIMLAGALKNLEVYSYTPLQVKSAVTGYGRADKNQVNTMVGKILNITPPKGDDEADALAISICHLNSQRGI